MAKRKLRIRKATGKTAAAYLRKSTDEQADSIPQQREAVRKHAAKHGYKLVTEYVDAGISGVDSAGSRPEFQRLVTDAEAGKFAVVFVWDQSRITRSDPMEAMAELRPLRQSGVSVWPTDKSEAIDWDSFAGQLMFAVSAGSNNDYVQRLSRHTVRGQYQRAKQGLWVTGRPPFGYVVDDDRKLQLGKSADVALVRWIYSQYLSGSSYRTIVAALQKKGHKRTVSWLTSILSNPFYVGDYVWGRNSQAKFCTISEGDVTTDLDDAQPWIHIADNHPAIVTRDQFEAIRALRISRKRGTVPIRGGGGWLLSGLLRCADCGARMQAISDKTSVQRRYRCSGYHSKSTDCKHSHIIAQDDLVKQIITSLQQQFDKPTLKRLEKEMISQVKQATKQVDLSKLKTRQKALRAKVASAGKRLMDIHEDLLEEFQESLRGVKSELADVDRQIEQGSKGVTHSLDEFRTKVDKALEALTQLAESIENAPPELVRDYLKEAIAEIRVHVSRKKVNGRYRYSFDGGEMLLNEGCNLSAVWSNPEQVLLPIFAVPA